LNDSINTYAWDPEGKPSSVDGVTVTYDAFGRSIDNSYPGTTLWAPDYSWSVYFQTGVARRGIFKLPGGAMAVYDEANGGLYFYGHPDHLGSLRLNTTPAHGLFTSTAIAPFGEPYAQSAVSPTSFTGIGSAFTIDLYDFPAREYSDQGRWASPDPAGLAAVDLPIPNPGTATPMC
jgi:hypothetical protein